MPPRRGTLRARGGGCRLAFAIGFLSAIAAHGTTCFVPSPSQPSLGAAVRDLSCTTIQLAAGTYLENATVARDLTIVGAGSGLSIVAGAVAVSGATTDAELSRLAVDGAAVGVAGCWPSILVATGGAHLVARDDVLATNGATANGACRLFADDFESGGVLAWSAHQP